MPIGAGDFQPSSAVFLIVKDHDFYTDVVVFCEVIDFIVSKKPRNDDQKIRSEISQLDWFCRQQNQLVLCVQ
jgi:hypothetical protein